MDELQKCAKDALNNENDVNLLANLSNISVSATKEILNNIAEKPEVSKEAKDFLWSEQTSSDLKVFNTGFEKGKKEGFSDGFTKGVLATVGIAAFGGLLMHFYNKNKK